MLRIRNFISAFAAAGTFLAIQTDTCGAGTFTTLYDFQNGTDGYGAWGKMTKDSSGNLYGTTYVGGGTGCKGSNGCGTVFKFITGTSSESVLYAFQGGMDGGGPESDLVRDSSGNLYGTTIYGGGTVFGHAVTGGCSDTGNSGCGTVFKVASDGTETVLYRFGGASDGAWPYAGLVMDSSGNLYGTTSAGGGNYNQTHLCTGADGTSVACGTVFKIAPNGTETILYSFCAQTNCADGAVPLGALVRDSSGNLYGTTIYGGGDNGSEGCSIGCGVVFKLTSGGTETVLHAFGNSDGFRPESRLYMDSSGNLYGTADEGGGNFKYGVIYKISSGGTFTVLYTFSGSDGDYPSSGLVAGPSSGGVTTLYGTTGYGGGTGCGGAGCGTIYQISTSGTFSSLFQFDGGSNDGAGPTAVMVGGGGLLYGTTSGTIFKYTTP